MNSSRPQVSWLSRSVIHSDGRRSITLWRSPSLERGDSRPAHRHADLKLRVQFPLAGAPLVLRFP